MVLLIAGASHTGKTALAQRLLEKYGYPYLSLDHLKMGLIRSKNTALTPLSEDKALTDYLWPIVREIIKTVIENGQKLIIEGCYIPFDWEKDFEERYLRQIKYHCLVMSEAYIRGHFPDIQAYADVVEKRHDGDCGMDALIRDNAEALKMCQKYGLDYRLIDDGYLTDMDLQDMNLSIYEGERL